MKNSTFGDTGLRKSRPANLDKIALTTSSGASAEVVLQGAHVISWRPANSDKDHLFVSKRAKYEPGTAIRGGVPVVFPQFSNRGPLDKHGFARVRQWQLLRSGELDDQRAQAVLRLASDQDTRQLWPHDFTATYTVTLHSDSLEMQLHIANSGATTFQFTAALHSYLDVGDIATARLHGLQGSEYVDYLEQEYQEPQGAAGYRIPEKVQTENREAALFRNAVDRVYHSTMSPLLLKSQTQTTEIHAEGFADTVVWNPWEAGSRKLVDMAEKDYQRMLCVEAAAVVNPIRLKPRESWTGKQVLVVTR